MVHWFIAAMQNHVETTRHSWWLWCHKTHLWPKLLSYHIYDKKCTQMSTRIKLENYYSLYLKGQMLNALWHQKTLQKIIQWHSSGTATQQVHWGIPSQGGNSSSIHNNLFCVILYSSSIVFVMLNLFLCTCSWLHDLSILVLRGHDLKCWRVVT